MLGAVTIVHAVPTPRFVKRVPYGQAHLGPQPPQGLRGTLGPLLPSSRIDLLGFAREFDVIVRTYARGYSDLYRLVHLPVSESKAKKWIKAASWRNPPEGFRQHEPEETPEL